MDLKQLRDFIVVPSLEHIGAYSLAAEQLVMFTGMVESKYEYIHQVGGGPARGLFQMEPRTHDDIWENWLAHKLHIVEGLKKLIMRDMDFLDQLHGNLFYAAAMCRIFYLRVPAALPDAGDWDGMAKYWKRYYNTHLGAGTIDGALQKAVPVMRFYGDEYDRTV